MSDYAEVVRRIQDACAEDSQRTGRVHAFDRHTALVIYDAAKREGAIYEVKCLRVLRNIAAMKGGLTDDDLRTYIRERLAELTDAE